MYASLSHLFFAGNTVDYLRLLAFGSMTSMLIGLILVKVLPPFEEDLTSSATDQGGDDSLEGEETYRPTNYVRRRTSSDIGARAWSADPDDLYNAENEDEETVGRNSRDANSNRAEDEREGLLGLYGYHVHRWLLERMGTLLFLRVVRCMYRLVHEIADELDND